MRYLTYLIGLLGVDKGNPPYMMILILQILEIIFLFYISKFFLMNGMKIAFSNISDIFTTPLIHDRRNRFPLGCP